MAPKSAQEFWVEQEGWDPSRQRGAYGLHCELDADRLIIGADKARHGKIPTTQGGV